MVESNMNDDAQLLRRYAEAGSESAFSELVSQHIDLVYSAALRQLNGDTHLAQDVAQTVFADLARKARTVSRHGVLTGWLYQATRYAASKVVRTELVDWALAMGQHMKQQRATTAAT